MIEDFVFLDLFDFFWDLEILVLFSLVPVSGRLVIISQLLSVPCTGTSSHTTDPANERPSSCSLTNQKAAPDRHQITDLTPPQLPGQLLLSKFPSGNFSLFRTIACTNLVPLGPWGERKSLCGVGLYPSNILQYLLLKVVVCSVYIFLIHQMSDLFSSWV